MLMGYRGQLGEALDQAYSALTNAEGIVTGPCRWFVVMLGSEAKGGGAIGRVVELLLVLGAGTGMSRSSRIGRRVVLVATTTTKLPSRARETEHARGRKRSFCSASSFMILSTVIGHSNLHVFAVGPYRRDHALPAGCFSCLQPRKQRLTSQRTAWHDEGCVLELVDPS
jgi:hypothetical protein